MEKNQFFLEIANKNLLDLANNNYPGRGLICGLDETEEYLVQVYWIMGRSFNSRNRIFVADDLDSLRTEAADPSKVEDPSLIIYQPMAKKGKLHIVSNGDQTNTVSDSGDLREAMLCRQYEPDAPNFTPRITAVSYVPGVNNRLYLVDMAIIRKTKFSSCAERQIFTYEDFIPGTGYCLTTYMGDGNPLPSFEGMPYILPLQGSITGVADRIWNSLNEDNRVSLAVKFINIQTGKAEINIMNKLTKV